MNESLIDTVARALGADSSRRGMLQGLSGLTLIGGIAPMILGDVAEARKRKKKRKKKKRNGGNDGGNDGGDGGGGDGGGGGNDCPFERCNGQCLDLDTDPNNCGSCGAACGGDVPCIGGRCAVAFGQRGEGDFQFDGPRGLAFASNGVSVLADGNNNRVAMFSTVDFQTFGETGEEDGQFLRPVGIAVNAATGDIYVTDIQRHCIQRFNTAGAFKATFGSFGNGRDFLNFPNGVAIDQVTGNIYIVNTAISQIKELDADLQPLADFGLINGPSPFNKPLGIAVDRDRNLVVADNLNNRIVVCDRAGNFIRAFGQAGSGNGEFDLPVGVAVAVNREEIFVVDQGNNRIQQFSADGRFLATFGRAGTGLGEFDAPFGIATNADGDLIAVADTRNNRVQFFFEVSAVTQTNLPATLEESRRSHADPGGKGRSHTAKRRHSRHAQRRSRR
jgi:DNA-binding beta-propeller fold protein YncE